MSESLLVEVEKVSKLAEEALRTRIKPTPPFENKVLSKISKTNKTLLAASLGTFGKRLKNFTEFCDINHPQVETIIAPLLASKATAELSDIIDITETAVNNNLVGLLGLLDSAFNANVTASVKTISTNLANMPVRVLKERTDREYARVLGSSNIDIDKGERIVKAPPPTILFNAFDIVPPNWSTISSTFASYVRLSSVGSEVVDRMNSLIKKLTSMDLSYQAAAYSRKIAEIKNRSTYCGFYKVTVEEVCSILGKVHNYAYGKNMSLSPEDPKIIDLLNFIVPSPAFSDLVCQFVRSYYSINEPIDWSNKRTIAENVNICFPNVDSNKLINRIYSYLVNEHQSNPITYQPRVYPIHAFQSILPERVKSMIESLEAFEDFSGKPLFDRFFVVVPGVLIQKLFFQNNSTLKYSFKLAQDSVELINKDEVAFLIDTYLIKRSAVYPIVLGKKDNEFYFLNYYW